MMSRNGFYCDTSNEPNTTQPFYCRVPPMTRSIHHGATTDGNRQTQKYGRRDKFHLLLPLKPTAPFASASRRPLGATGKPIKSA
jgi:hypothetical protein